MSILTQYQTRFSDEIRTNISNPQGSAATTPNTTLEGLAADDTEGEFLKRGIVYDNTDKRHVATACIGVKARLLVFVAQTGGDDEWKAFKRDVEFLAESTSRDRIAMASTSLLQESSDTMGALPATDKSDFRGYLVNPPNSPPNQA